MHLASYGRRLDLVCRGCGLSWHCALVADRAPSSPSLNSNSTVALSVFPSCGLLIAWQTPRKNVLVPIIFFSTFFPSRCSLVSKEDSVDFLSSKHVLQVLVTQSQNFLLPFSVFEASLVVDGVDGNEFQSFLPVWKGERRMKDAVHCRVHRSVHPYGERKLLRTQRLHTTRRWILDTGKTQNWAGATPLRCHGNRGGRSSPGNSESRCSPCVLPVSS
jgi:hypothetical protein